MIEQKLEELAFNYWHESQIRLQSPANPQILTDAGDRYSYK